MSCAMLMTKHSCTSSREEVGDAEEYRELNADEARQIAVVFARLPELVAKSK